MPVISVVNGPNLNMIECRDATLYGRVDLGVIEEQLKDLAAKLSYKIVFCQSNHEGALIDAVQEAVHNKHVGMIVNPGGYSHTSIAMRDALEMVKAPKVEVHLSQLYKREDYRQKSITAGAVDAVISGMGDFGYVAALQYLHHCIRIQ